VRIERRRYQEFIIAEILKAKKMGKNLIVELDAGMGKRIISYLLIRYLSPDDNILIITPSQASLKDTVSTFKQLYKSEKKNVDEIGYVSAGIPAKMKRSMLTHKRVVVATPISLVNILRKEPSLINRFSVIIINEVDKVVRRAAEKEEDSDLPVITTAKEISEKTASKRKKIVLTYPWNELKNLIPKDVCLIGMSGTLRDKHILKTLSGDVIFKPELETLVETLFPKDRKLEIITMDMLLSRTDAYVYTIRNITIVNKIEVRDEKIETLVNVITDEITKTAEKIATRYSKMFAEKNIEKIEKALPLIPETDYLKRKFLRLALIRRFILASVPEHYSRFLKRSVVRKILENKTGSKIDDLIPEKSSKILKIIEMTKNWISLNKKVTILTSFIRVAKKIKQELEKLGLKTYLITGQVLDKGQILEKFKHDSSTSVLVMTPVGERDIDLAEIDLIIVHDIISTVKTMYQRIKRGRKCIVAILYYGNTFEERKVNKLLERMKKQYPWSLKVEI